jgi:tetratricopeptide (TPR) repeat protein
MKNLKVQFKLIICVLLFLNTFNVLLAKNTDEFYKAEDITNYFSGTLAVNDNQYQKSYDYLKSLNGLEDSHYRYSQYYHYSLVALEKYKDAKNYSKKLEKKGIDNFESNLISIVYYLERENLDKALVYIEELRNNSLPGSIQNLISTSLSSWANFKNISNINSALNLLDNIPRKFKNIKNIQKAFAYCHFDSSQTDEVYRKLTSRSDINYSRYFFFHANYLISNKKEQKVKKVLEISLNLDPTNLILNQLKLDREQANKFNNRFDCKNTNHVLAEILYIVASGLAAQQNYVASNFYLNLAKYLNPNFISFETLQAENFLIIDEHNEAKKIYNVMQKHGSTYSWYASKQTASILIKQKKKKEAVSFLEKKFQKINNPTTYEMFDYAEFLKNNEKYEESIEYYSKAINTIDRKHDLYGRILDGRGIAHERTDQWKKAEADLLNSLSVSPNDAYVINYLAYSWIEKGINVEKSLKMLKKANALRPNDGYIIDSLGWALFKLKNYKDAKKYLQLAVIYMASDPVINDHYADSLWMSNNSLQARYYWNYVLKLEETKEKLKTEIKKKLLFGIKKHNE